VVVRAGAEAVLGQCTPSWLSGTDPQLCLNARISRRILNVSGSTSLTDGAIVQVWAEDFGTGYGEHWITDTVNFTVVDGAFGGTFDLSSWGAGTVTVSAVFAVGSQQPAEIIDRYGVNGERLKGPDVQFGATGVAPPAQAVQVSVNADLSAG
jgi:hypothetical protein